MHKQMRFTILVRKSCMHAFCQLDRIHIFRFSLRLPIKSCYCQIPSTNMGIVFMIAMEYWVTILQAFCSWQIRIWSLTQMLVTRKCCELNVFLVSMRFSRFPFVSHWIWVPVFMCYFANILWVVCSQPGGTELLIFGLSVNPNAQWRARHFDDDSHVQAH